MTVLSLKYRMLRELLELAHSCISKCIVALSEMIEEAEKDHA